MFPTQLEHGLDLLRKARRAYGQGVIDTEIGDAGAEARLREALQTGASALNWLEASEHEEQAHRQLDEMGRFAREHFAKGCHLDWTGRGYEHRCPVFVAHKRIGFSIGFRTKRKECSICGTDISECEHMPGTKYQVNGGVDSEGCCVVCGDLGCERHLEGQSYEVYAAAIIREATIEEVSMVGRPKHPDARLSALPLSTQDLKEQLGPGFRPGMPLYCSRCLPPCDGLDRPFG